MPFEIRDGFSTYIHVEYKTREDAEREMANLLRPYPFRHEWRRRLKVVEIRGQVLPVAQDEVQMATRQRRQGRKRSA